MPGLTDIALALLLTFGGHEMGHQLEADRLNVPMSFDNKMIAIAHTQNPDELSRIANAGIEGQEIISGAVSDTKREKSVRFFSALNKFGYAFIPGGIQGGKGDIRLLEQSKGKKARYVAQGALIISATSDFLIAFDKIDGAMGLIYGQSKHGTPMLILRGNF